MFASSNKTRQVFPSCPHDCDGRGSNMPNTIIICPWKCLDATVSTPYAKAGKRKLVCPGKVPGEYKALAVTGVSFPGHEGSHGLVMELPSETEWLEGDTAVSHHYHCMDSPTGCCLLGQTRKLHSPTTAIQSVHCCHKQRHIAESQWWGRAHCSFLSEVVDEVEQSSREHAVSRSLCAFNLLPDPEMRIKKSNLPVDMSLAKIYGHAIPSLTSDFTRYSTAVLSDIVM